VWYLEDIPETTWRRGRYSKTYKEIMTITAFVGMAIKGKLRTRKGCLRFRAIAYMSENVNRVIPSAYISGCKNP
jgi:hypothetical protein